MINAKWNGGGGDGENERGKSVVLNRNDSVSSRTTTTKIHTSGGNDSTAAAHGDRGMKSSLDGKGFNSGGNADGLNANQYRRSFRSWPFTIKGCNKLKPRRKICSQSPQRSPRMFPEGRSGTRGGNSRKEFVNSDPIPPSSSSPYHRDDYVVGKNSEVLKLEANNNLLVSGSDSPPYNDRRWSGNFFSVSPIGPAIPEQQSRIYKTIIEAPSPFQISQKLTAFGSSALKEANFESGRAWELQLPDGTLIKVSIEGRGGGGLNKYIHVCVCVCVCSVLMTYALQLTVQQSIFCF